MVTITQSGYKKMRMHEETISATCLRLIKDLSVIPQVNKFYLVGGTALSLQFGHRKSIDLDFFTDEQIDYNELHKNLSNTFNLEVHSQNKNFLKVEIESVKTEFINFAYKPKFELIEWNGIRMINPTDVGLYKLLAILGRSTKKDIVDLYFIDKEVISIEDLFQIFMERFDPGDINLFKQTELLFIKEKIELSDMPEMLFEIDFNEALETVKFKLLTAIRKSLGIDSVNI